MTSPGEDSPTRDPLIDKLFALFGGVTQQHPGFMPEYGTAALAGMPMKDVCEMVRLYYRAEVAKTLTEIRHDVDKYGPWNPADWIVVAPPYLFTPDLTAIGEVALIRGDGIPAPDWSVYVVRSTAWWSKQIEQMTWPQLSGPSSANPREDVFGSLLREHLDAQIAKARRDAYRIVEPGDFIRLTTEA